MQLTIWPRPNNAGGNGGRLEQKNPGSGLTFATAATVRTATRSSAPPHRITADTYARPERDDRVQPSRPARRRPEIWRGAGVASARREVGVGELKRRRRATNAQAR